MQSVTVENLLMNGMLIGALGFFIRIWINGLKASIDNIKSELKLKIDIVACDKTHRIVDRQAHTHGSLGTAGEVIE